jgi:hypothetical protein
MQITCYQLRCLKKIIAKEIFTNSGMRLATQQAIQVYFPGF